MVNPVSTIVLLPMISARKFLVYSFGTILKLQPGAVWAWVCFIATYLAGITVAKRGRGTSA